MRDATTSPGEPLPAPAVTVRHSTGATPVYVGTGLLARLGEITAEHAPGRRLAVIADAAVATYVPRSVDAPTVTFPSGESAKTRETWASLTDQLLALGIGRDGAIVALGGGVAGDLGGFVAATYHRGLPWFSVPTSLLAMLDAAIGGKTAVDTPAGKNLVGAFHQPAAAIMDPATLRTLPIEELRSGLAEAVKHAAIRDAVHFGWLGAAAGTILGRDLGAIEALVKRSVAIKAEVVEADEHERGRRAILNIGHTVGHAIEAATGYRIRHGEAVAIGLVAESRAGEAMGITERGTANELSALFSRLGLPVDVPAGLDRGQLIPLMRGDKKNRGGKIRLALLARIGAAAGRDQEGWTTEIDEDVLQGVL